MTIRAIAIAAAAFFAGAAPAHAASTVVTSSIALRITLDTVANDTMSISVTTPGTFRVTDGAGVIQDPGDEATCTQVNGQTLDCPYSVIAMPRVDIVSPVAKPGRDVVNASGAPTRVTLIAPANDIEITGSAFNDILRGSAGADILAGAGGTDQLTGGAGGIRSPAAQARTPSSTTPITPAASTSRSAVATATTATPRTGPSARATPCWTPRA